VLPGAKILAFETDDFAGAFAHHKEKGCICYENPQMGIYFIADPDGYWLEVLPKKRFYNYRMISIDGYFFFTGI